MVPQPWLSDTAEKHYVVPRMLPQDIARANVERSVHLLIEGMEKSRRDFAKAHSLLEAAKSQDDYRRFIQTQQSLLQTYLRQQSGTSCEWLFKLKAYQKWMNEVESPLLWLKGSPGAGKSTLSSVLVRDLYERHEPGSAIAFCFFDSRQGQASSARYILKALAYQLRDCIRRTGAESALHSTIREDDKLTGSMSLDQFQRKLRGVFVSVDITAPVFLVLDGLNDDDDEGVKKVILHEILRVNRSREKSHIFRCFITSRFKCEARISKEDLIQIDMSTESGVQNDMFKFATTQLENILRTSPKQTAPVYNLAEQLCSRANGIFLWLALSLEDIQQVESALDPVDIIRTLPASIDTFYQRALQKIPSQDVEMAQRIFSWLTVASRLLYLPELQEALAVRADRIQYYEQASSAAQKHDLSKTQAEIRRICGWLVTITEEGIVSLRHPTLREYLLSEFEPSTRSRHPVLVAHELVARSCLVLLSSSIWVDAASTSTAIEPAQKLGRWTTSTLTGYAAANWSVHYRLSETYSRSLAGTLQRCLTLTLEFDCQYFSIPNSGRSIQVANTTLRISASYGLVSLTQLCLQMGTDPRGGSCVLCEPPLAIAARGGHLVAAKILLKGTADATFWTSDKADIIIHLALARGLVDEVKSFLECGAHVDAVEHESGKTLLHVAAESGRLDMVRLLIAYNANLNAFTPTTQETPLHLAAVRGYTHIVKYIVDGRDPSMRELELYDSIVRQPYYQAWTEHLLANDRTKESIVWEVEARDNAEEHMRKLRSSSARYSNIDLRTSTGCTALELAAANGYDDVVRFLLERGANIKGDGVKQCTALQVAVENGHLQTVKLLLTAGARMHRKTDGLAPILQHACDNGHNAVADLVVWYCFNAELSANQFQWPILCLPSKATNTVVRDVLLRKKRQTKSSRLDTHSGFMQGLSKIAERPKV